MLQNKMILYKKKIKRVELTKSVELLYVLDDNVTSIRRLFKLSKPVLALRSESFKYVHP